MNLWTSDPEGHLPGPGSLESKTEVGNWKWLIHQCLESPRTLEPEFGNEWQEQSFFLTKGPEYQPVMRLRSGQDCPALFQASSSPDGLPGWEVRRKKSGDFWTWVEGDTDDAWETRGFFLSEGLQ